MGADKTISLTVDGRQVWAPVGRTVAAVLMLETERISWRQTRGGEAPRGLFCGIGVCFDCLVHVDGLTSMRACLVPAREGMVVQTHWSDTPAAQASPAERPEESSADEH